MTRAKPSPAVKITLDDLPPYPIQVSKALSIADLQSVKDHCDERRIDYAVYRTGSIDGRKFTLWRAFDSRRDLLEPDAEESTQRTQQRARIDRMTVNLKKHPGESRRVETHKPARTR
ncbi:hypothetical protein LCGC14_0412530 [marine sediment metagenome]|uniref:Uncharacterized protein n=1 Tax=marine sediment metagenome TaxID=412755 RepID=A0A0F9TBI5_9ZZZZ